MMSTAPIGELCPVRETEFGKYCEFVTSFNTTVGSSDVHLAAQDKYFEHTEPMTTRLEAIFRGSFPLSNGYPLLQFELQVAALEAMAGLGADLSLMQSTLRGIELDPSKFYPPKNHLRLKPEGIDQRVSEIWETFVDIGNNLTTMENVTETNELPSEAEWTLLKNDSALGMHWFMMLRYMAIRDRGYLADGRPGQSSSKESCRSILKQYVLDQKPTRSPELDYVTATMRATLAYMLENPDELPHKRLRRIPKTSLIPLAQEWEARHEGQFWPKDIARFLGHSTIAHQLEGDGFTIVNGS